MEPSHAVTSLEKRLAALERKTYGDDLPGEQTKCIESLINVQNQLQSAVTGREKITNIFSKLNELNHYLSPEFRENVNLSESCKLNLVLLAEDNIRNVVDALQTVKDYSQYLDSEHIRATPSLMSKFLSLSQVCSDQKEQVSNVSAETKNLLGTYDEIIMCISKEFVLWDAILTRLEEQKLSREGD